MNKLIESRNKREGRYCGKVYNWQGVRNRHSRGYGNLLWLKNRSLATMVAELLKDDEVFFSKMWLDKPDEDDNSTLPGTFTSADDLFKAMGV